jgi:hypothetical protein
LYLVHFNGFVPGTKTPPGTQPLKPYYHQIGLTPRQPFINKKLEARYREFFIPGYDSSYLFFP